MLSSKFSAPVGLMVIALSFVFQNKYLPSADGPAHIYNAQLLKEYLLGNQVVQQHFVLNDLYIPNLFSTFFLTFLVTIFSLTIALKAFYFSLLFLLIYSAYYFFKAFGIRWPFLLSLAFILLFNSFLLNIGFYNFCFSIAFMLFAFGFYHRKFGLKASNRVMDYLVYFFLAALLYFSNGLSFAIFIAFVGFSKILELIATYKRGLSGELGTLLKQIFMLIVISLPFILMLLVFQQQSNMVNEFGEVDSRANWNNLIAFSSFISYDRVSEGKVVFWMALVIVALLTTSIINRFIRANFKLRHDDGFFLMMLVFVGLYFVIPDNYSVGFMSVRLQFFIYFFALLWMFIQPGVYFKYIAAVALFALSIYKYSESHSKTVRDLNEHAGNIISADKYVEANKTVAILNFSGNWLEYHFPNYLGLRKPIILLENYEANVGWFCLKWNVNNMPTYTTNGMVSFQNFHWNVIDNKEKKEVDYIFLYCGVHLVKENKELANLLSNYERQDKGELEGVAIFKRKNK